ncbi:unnamed protein product [Microthlaspi erraticum]|uniref:Uncharacterized protein n=1 Tax=Microthlaspi erraticum TaxID=1685480 RepID=A0A6D2L8C4_9BRAS|nr:unnamed protein product [Microthlaspi erraticum]
MFRSAKHPSVSRQSTAELTYDPGKHVPRSAQASPPAAHDRRASREASLAAAQLTYHGRCTVRAGKHVPRPAEIIGQTIRRPHGRPKNPPATIDPTVPIDHDRPERRGRPEARFEARFTRFQRPGLTLSRL